MKCPKCGIGLTVVEQALVPTQRERLLKAIEEYMATSMSKEELADKCKDIMLDVKA